MPRSLALKLALGGMDCPKRRRGIPRKKKKRRRDTEAAVGLPDGPLVEILSRVPVRSLCRFKCVSKGWRDLIADPHHRKQLPQTLEGFFLAFDKQHCESDSSCSVSDSDDGDGEDCRYSAYWFVDVFGTSVRPVDFSFLAELGGIDIRLLRCCNGLLLFVAVCDSDMSNSYIVCSPATKQYVSVPYSPCFGNGAWDFSQSTYLLFDPGASSHFHLVHFGLTRDSLYVYSSETQAWSHNKCDWDHNNLHGRLDNFPNAYVNGMLHLILRLGKTQLAAVDVEGNIQKIIPLPYRVQAAGWKLSLFPLYIGQSQGCLHYICLQQKIPSDRGERIRERLLIWVLQDYERQQWVLKDTISLLKFGKRSWHSSHYGVVGIHPDRNLVFLVQHWDQKLISYHMDSKEVCDLCTLGHGYERIAPYVPYFLEFGA